ncbi:MAG: hypothetical protein JEZ00_11570 [Anaerolineaceae bacterium]|nr:hypothetical protein [Anaerolineaceae bacterium]
MKKNNIYSLLNDVNLYDNKPELITANNIQISNTFEPSKLLSEQRRLNKDWVDDATIWVNGHIPVDYLTCSNYIEVLSSKAKDIIEEFAKDEVEFLPITVKLVLKSDIQYRYWVIHVLNYIEPLDWENTIWSKKPDSKKDSLAYLSIIKPVFYSDNVENSNFFKINIVGKTRHSIYLSEIIKTKLIREKCNLGMDFGKIKLT